MIEREIHIGSQSRTLKCTSKSTILFKAWMPGNIGLREALILHSNDPGVVAIALASFLRHKDRGGDEKITPGRVGGWIDAELGRFPEFEKAAIDLAEEYFLAAGVIEKEPERGEVKAPPVAPPAPSTAPSSTSGTPSSASPADGGSTPASSSS